MLYAPASVYSRSAMKITLLLSTIAVLATSSSIPGAKTSLPSQPESVGPRAGLEPIYSRVLAVGGGGGSGKCSVKFCHAPYHPKGWCPYESSETYSNISNLEQNLTCGCTCDFS